MVKKMPDKVTNVLSVLPRFIVKSIFRLMQRYPPKTLQTYFESKKLVDGKSMNVLRKKKAEANSLEDTLYAIYLDTACLLGVDEVPTKVGLFLLPDTAYI